MVKTFLAGQKPLIRYLIIGGGLVIVVGGGFLLNKSLHPHPKQTTIPAVNTEAQASNSQADNKSSASNSNTSTPASDKATSVAANGPLIEPSGTFVSNHHPSLSGSSSPSTEQSVCKTTPGATCRIEFKKGDETKTLPEQTADANGAVYWTWDVKTAGFSTGSWQITAIARSDGQSKSTQDSLNLEVAP